MTNPETDPVAATLRLIGVLEQSAPHDPPTRRHGIAHLRDRIAWHTETLRVCRKRIEEHVAEAERLETECTRLEQIIAELRYDINVLGSIP